ncbi:MAG: hypothetical protein RIT06_932 [Chloroflexota bacterium]|jgi:hypothetical protein
MRLLGAILAAALVEGCSADTLSTKNRLIDTAEAVAFLRAEKETQQLSLAGECVVAAMDKPALTGSTLMYRFQLDCRTPLNAVYSVFYEATCEYAITDKFDFVGGTYRTISSVGENEIQITDAWVTWPACPPSE